jgi:hypothetical protein
MPNRKSPDLGLDFIERAFRAPDLDGNNNWCCVSGKVPIDQARPQMPAFF